ncbi:MAG: hypothetical protein K9K93_03790 [Acholeplasmataceae bacterium]|nr:hypothetical protein [Acholeplasmataceae bacterium]
MKKALTLMTVFAAVLFLTACLQPISEVETFTISEWTPKEYYDLGDADALWNASVTLDVVYNDGAEETLNLGTGIDDGTVTITGDYSEDPLGLKTDVAGFYEVTISVDNISLTFEYYVFDMTLARNVPGTYATIGAALSGAPAGAVVFVEDGLYEESISISTTANLTIYGESVDGVIIDSSDQTSRVFQAASTNGLTLINLTFRDDYTVGGGSQKRFMVKISNADDITLRHVVIEGPGKQFANAADGNEPVGGLDLNGVDNADVINVTVEDVSRNGMAFASVTNLRLIDFEINNAGLDNSGWAALALYVSEQYGPAPTTLVEATGSIDNANIGINYSVAPYDGFEFGNIIITMGDNPLAVQYPLFLYLPQDDPEPAAFVEPNGFALNVTGLPWLVSFPYPGGGTGLIYFLTEDQANAAVDVLALSLIVGTAENINN